MYIRNRYFRSRKLSNSIFSIILQQAKSHQIFFFLNMDVLKFLVRSNFFFNNMQKKRFLKTSIPLNFSIYQIKLCVVLLIIFFYPYIHLKFLRGPINFLHYELKRKNFLGVRTNLFEVRNIFFSVYNFN